MSAHLYVEGGGDTRELQARCRRAFTGFLSEAGLKGRMPKVVACGPGNRAGRLLGPSPPGGVFDLSDASFEATLGEGLSIGLALPVWMAVR